MRILGIDPGLTRLGMAVVDRGSSRTALSLRDVDVARSDAQLAIPDRLVQLAGQVRHWLLLHRPDEVAIEQVFMQRNVSNAVGTAQAVGVVSLLAREHQASVTTYTPTQVKAAVSGHGGAHKDQVATMVVRLLKLQAVPKPADAADAAAVAVCHALRRDAPELHRVDAKSGATPAQRQWVQAHATTRVTSWEERIARGSLPNKGD